MSAIHTVTGIQRALGCVLGSAIGDALGAPFEFGPADAYSRRFPSPVLGGRGEMIGGGPFAWAPGQFTDDTEMAVLVAESLLSCGGIDPDDQLARFRAWGRAAADVGNLTREVLSCGLPADSAAQHVYDRRGGHSTAGNGSLMRAAPAAVHFAAHGRDATMDAARRLSAVTHADPMCQWAVAIHHELIRSLLGECPIGDSVESALEPLPAPIAAVYRPLLAATWTPGQTGPGNGSAMGALAQAVWAVRHHDRFADAVIAVIDLGGDTDSVAAVTGALAGARSGIQAIPARWLTYLHGETTDPHGVRRRYDHLDLQQLTRSLIGWPQPNPAADEPRLEPAEVRPGVWATNRAGARNVPDDWAVISLCRIDETMRHPVRREPYLVDQAGEVNLSVPDLVDELIATIDAFRGEGRQVVVHCHGGRSRTALVLAAYLMHQGLSLAEARRELAASWPTAHFRNPTFAAELERRDTAGF